MPYTYTAQEVAFAMQMLVENLGDVQAAAQKTGIPERTLQRWKYKFSVNTVLVADEPESTKEKAIYERYSKIRDNLLDHIDHLYQQMSKDPEKAADLAIALSRLIDRLSRLENLLGNRHFSVIVLYEAPDGDVYDHPLDSKSIEDMPF